MHCAIHVDNVVVRVADHDVAGHIIQGLTDSGVFGSLLTLLLQSLFVSGLARQFLGAVHPLDRRTQAVVIEVIDRGGNEAKGSDTNFDIGFMDVFEGRQHGLLVLRFLVENVDAGAHELVDPEIGQLFANVCFRRAQHLDNRIIHVDDVVVGGADHYVGLYGIKCLLDTRVLGSLLAFLLQPGVVGFLTGQLFGAIFPLHCGSQSTVVVIKNGSGDQAKGAATDLDIGLVHVFQRRQHGLLVLGFLVEYINIGTLQVVHPEVW